MPRAWRLTHPNSHELAPPLERAEQAAVIRWAFWMENRWPELRWLFHPANGEKREKKTAALLAALGVKRGVPDLWLPVPRGPYVGLAIEMKRVNGKGPTEQQELWLDGLAEMGWRTQTCWGADEAIDLIRQYMSQPAIQLPATRIDQEARSGSVAVHPSPKP